eukprot:184100-Rhodomonas_salina.1
MLEAEQKPGGEVGGRTRSGRLEGSWEDGAGQSSESKRRSKDRRTSLSLFPVTLPQSSSRAVKMPSACQRTAEQVRRRRSDAVGGWGAERVAEE